MLPTYRIRTPKRSTSSSAARYIWLTRLLGSENSNSSAAVGPKYLVLYSMNGPILTPAMAHTPMRVALTQPNWISFATSIIATGTPCEWQATRMKSASLMWSIQFRSSFHSVLTLSAMNPSPSSATCSISGQYPRASDHSLIAAAAALAKRIEVPVGCPMILWKMGAGKNPCTPMATAFLIR